MATRQQRHLQRKEVILTYRDESSFLFDLMSNQKTQCYVDNFKTLAINLKLPSALSGGQCTPVKMTSEIANQEHIDSMAVLLQVQILRHILSPTLLNRQNRFRDFTTVLGVFFHDRSVSVIIGERRNLIVIVTG